MKIKTITCHDVYNVGASLQAYALQRYLTSLGHDVKIIDYKPDYLSRHYSLTNISNPKYNHPLVREAYIAAKLPGRIKARLSKRKSNFDNFKRQYLELTKCYHSYVELCQDPPEADVFFAGSDQIWNPLFSNGKDPAFYLQFVKDQSIKASYAASFAVNTLESDDLERAQQFIHHLDYVSVRENSALKLLQQMQINGTCVCDPVFLLNANIWKKLAILPNEHHYAFIYDFDQSDLLQKVAARIKEHRNIRIVSAFSNSVCDQTVPDMGPLEFLGMILNADIVLSNSFHATAFAIMFHKDFLVIPRSEAINSRMNDLLADIGLSDRMVYSWNDLNNLSPINWHDVDDRINRKILKSKNFIDSVLVNWNRKQ